MTEAERAAVVAALPSEFPVSESAPPEGDAYIENVLLARETLRRWYDRMDRSIYIGNGLPVYYPGERMFSPDVLAVLDVRRGEPDSWIVSKEGKGLDLAIEIHVAGHRRKDTERNVELFARLGIAEYFVFEVRARRLMGWRLPNPATSTAYQRMVPQGGRFPSRVLGMDLVVEGERLRFYLGEALVPSHREVIGRLTGAVDDALARAEAEAARADAAERELDELRRELAALRARLDEPADE